MVEMTYNKFVKNKLSNNTPKIKKKFLKDEIFIGISIILVSIILFLLFREFLDHYGDKLDAKNKEIQIENIRTKYSRDDNINNFTSDNINFSNDIEYFKDLQDPFKSENQIPEPIPVMENELDEKTGIKNIGVTRNIKPNKEHIFSKQLAIDDEQMNNLIQEVKMSIKNKPLSLKFKNYNILFKKDKIRTIHSLMLKIIKTFLIRFNEKMVDLKLYHPKHLIEDFKFMNFRIVNTLDADIADYNKVWIQEDDKNYLLNRNEVIISEESNGTLNLYKAKRKKDIGDTKQIDTSKLTENDRILLNKYKNNNLIDFKNDGNKIHVKIGRDQKYQHFIIYLDLKMNYNESNDIFTIKIIDISLISTLNNYNLITSNVIQEGYMKPINIDQNNLRNIASHSKPYDIFDENDIPSNYFDDKFKEQHIDQYHYNKAVSDKKDKKKCFAVVDGKSKELPYKNKLHCESYHSNIDQIGIWDGPCQINDECPFYQSNKNYKNEFGGCNVGYCEMPLGVTRIGYKKYTKDEPYCYNCPIGSDSKCCSQQYLDSNKDESRILSPDIVFIGDCETDGQYRKDPNNIKLLSEKELDNCPSI